VLTGIFRPLSFGRTPIALVFDKATDFPPGTVFSLLSQSWQPLWNDILAEKIRQFDTEVYENPTTVGACTYITTLDGSPAGMFSWDPRKGPEVVIIGWNCILPGFQGKGIGKAQIREMLKRFKQAGFKKVAVTTGQDPFFLPAQRIYLACGFTEVQRHPAAPNQRYGSIDYILLL
jgi:GNAT superfamily N-acetyltransferase